MPYQIALPFRNPQIKMPNNRTPAEQRANQLSRKLKKDLKFYGDYKQFINDIIKKGYAQNVPQNKLDCDDTRV